MAPTGWGWGNTANDDEQDDGLTSSLVYGSKGEGTEAQPSAAPESLPGAQPSAGNYSTGEGYGGNGMARGRSTQPTPPTYSPSPLPTAPDRQMGQEQQLEQQITKYGTPINRQDPSVKPKWYERLAGGLAGGLIGVRNPGEGIQAGSSIVNRRYNQADQARQQSLGSAQQQMQDFRANRQDANQDFERQLQLHNAGTQDYNAQERAYQGQVQANDRSAQEQQRLQGIAQGTEQPDDPNNPMGGWHATTVGGQQIKMQGPPDAWLKTGPGVQSSRDQYIKQHGLKGDDAKFYSANGKLKEPGPQIHIHNPSGAEQEWNAYVSSLGRKPTTEDVLNYHHSSTRAAGGQMSKNDSDRIIKDRNSGFEKAQAAYHKAIAGAETPDEKQEAENDYLDAAETVQRGFEDRIKSKTGNDIEPFDIRGALNQSLHGGGSAPAQQQTQQPAQPAPAAPQAPPQRAQAQPAPAGGLPRGNGQALDRATGQKFLDAAGGDKEKARQLARQQGFKF